MDTELHGRLGDGSPTLEERLAELIGCRFGKRSCRHGYESKRYDYGCQPHSCNQALTVVNVWLTVVALRV
jgi:hypothetical protein